MPGNIVKINDYDRLEWYVGDSRMGELIALRLAKGQRINETKNNNQ